MTELVLLGAGRFALEIARFAEATGEFERIRFLALPGEEVIAPRARTLALDDTQPASGTPVLLATSDVDERRRLIDDIVGPRGLLAVNVVHPTSAPYVAIGASRGNLVGPNCYFGVNTIIGDFNVFNYHCTIGHHSSVGSNNFVAPNFHTGNRVTIGDDVSFGLSCTVHPGITIGSGGRFQIGTAVAENTRERHIYMPQVRIIALPRNEGAAAND